MLRKRFVALLLLPALGALVHGAAQAQMAHAAPSIGPRATFYRARDADHGVWAPGVQGKLGLSPNWALQLSADFAHYAAGPQQIHSRPIQASALWFLQPASPASPYALIGYGWYPTSMSDGAGSHRETQSRPHVGAGLEILSAGNWSLDGSYRFIWSEVYRPWDAKHPYGQGFRERGSMWTAALNRRF